MSMADNQLFGVKFGVGETAVDDRYRPNRGHVVNLEYEQVTGDYTLRHPGRQLHPLLHAA